MSGSPQLPLKHLFAPESASIAGDTVRLSGDCWLKSSIRPSCCGHPLHRCKWSSARGKSTVGSWADAAETRPAHSKGEDDAGGGGCR